MGQLRGFWTPRRRRGQEDARILAAEQVHALRRLPYADLAARAKYRADVGTILGLSGDRYRRRTSIRRIGSGERERLRILVSVDRGTLLGRLDPLAEEMVLRIPTARWWATTRSRARATTLAATACPASPDRGQSVSMRNASRRGRPWRKTSVSHSRPAPSTTSIASMSPTRTGRRPTSAISDSTPASSGPHQ